MLNFVFRKIWNKKWMGMSLLIGNLFLIAIAAVCPMYSQAVLQLTLTRSLNNYYVETNQNPGTIVFRGDYRSSSRKKAEDYSKIGQAEELVMELDEELEEDLELPVLYSVTRFYKNEVKAVHEMVADGESGEMFLQLESFSEVEDHIQIINGEMYNKEPDGNTIDVIVNERTFVERHMVLGEVLELVNLKDPSGVPYKIRIAGVFENRSEQDPYWVVDPQMLNSCLVDEEVFRTLVLDDEQMSENFNAVWYKVLDYSAMRGDRAEDYLDVVNKYLDIFESMEFDENDVYFQSILENFLVEEQKLNTTILVLQIPIFVLLAVFIFMVSRQMLEMEQNEIAVYKSRGADKKQILLVYLLQSVIISLMGLVGGIPLGVLMCKLLGASNSFLEFVKRTALDVELGPTVWLLAGCAVVFSICTMVLPVIKYADINIVAHKRGKNRASRFPLWQKACVDVILLGVALYGLYQYNEQKEYLYQKVMEGAALDMLLYLCSTLFMIGAGLLFLRIFPLLIRVIYEIGKQWWPPALYASYLRILRTKSNQGFLMGFLILTLAMGVFNAQAARTINANAEDRIRYSMGADLVLQELWEDNGGEEAGLEETIYEEPDFAVYESMEGIESATKVLVDENVKVSAEQTTINHVKLMGIHTKEFGETAWMKASLLSNHWYEYLNAISQNARAILVSSNFRDLYGYEVGDIMNYKNSKGEVIGGIIYGFVDYWPSYLPATWEKDETGTYVEKDHFLIVAHLSQIQSSWGVTPYQIWIKTKDSSQFIYEYAEESGTKYLSFQDASADLVSLKNDPIFQGTNGILTIGFICILLVCITGFLIYWILSIQSRTLQFGIFRAMGMSMKEVLGMLLNEQFFITGLSIGAGVLVGILTSKLYIPLVQIAYSSSDQVIPLEIISEGSDYLRLFGVIGLAILICMFILGSLISKIGISQALKLGED